MANLVNLEQVTKSFGIDPVLDGVSLGLDSGERIGIVGRNGGGKSTLLRLITGQEQPDSGRVTRNRGLHIVSVDQRDVFGAGNSVRDVVVGDTAEHEWAGDSAIRSVLAGLGLHRVGLDVPVSRLSGGERRRVALARALIEPADLVLLDEPTNHLDIEGIAWLAEHLRVLTSALMVVTHDRWFLDEVVERTWEVQGGQVHQFDGGYAAYVLARAERDRQADTLEIRRQNLMRKELAWLRRGPPARTSKPKFRIDAANALIADVPPPRESIELRAMAGRRLGKQVYELSDATIMAGDRVLMRDLDWHVGPGDRIGVIGVNGSGKTHLLDVLAERKRPVSGTVRVGSTVRPGYLSQELTELPGKMRVLEAVRDVRESATLGGVELSAGQLAERFGFGSKRQWTPVSELSGGERRRLQLLRILLAEPNVLLLDVPTNDLDTDMLAELEDLLDSWAGTMVVVSHDRYLLERVCDTIVAIRADGSLAALPGGVDQYLAERANAGGPNSAGSQPTTGDTAPTPSDGNSSVVLSPAEIRVQRKQLGALERLIARLDTREKQLHSLLAENAADYAKVAELDTELRQVHSDREAAETQWLELSDLLG